MHFIGFYDYTVILTYISVIAGINGVGQASKGHMGAAIICLIISGICDAFDGTVARSKKNRTDHEKMFGIQIDSLCDVISFGVVPALIAYNFGMKGIVGVTIICIYTICAVIRLAFFNVIEGERQKVEDGCNKVYRGLPVTTISMIMPIFYLCKNFVSPENFVIALHVVMAAVAFLFVLDFKVKKPHLVLFKKA